MMLFPILYFLITIIGLGIASYTDLKTRMVYNKLTFPMAVLGLLLHGIEAIIYSSLTPLILSVIGGAFGFGFAYVLYRMGVWAGGDVKLLMAVGTLNPLAPLMLSSAGLFAGQISLPVFPLTFTIYSILAAFPYILAVSLLEILKSAELRKKIIGLRGLSYATLMTGLVTLVYTAVRAINGDFITFLISMAVITLLSLALTKIKNNGALVALGFIGLIIASFIGTVNTVLYNFIYTLIVFVLIDIILNTIKVTRNDVLRYYKKITDVKEGEIIAELIYIDTKGKVVVYDKSLAKKAIDVAMGKMPPIKTVLADPNVAAGIEPEQIKKLKALVKQKKLKNRIRVKKSTAFAPVFLLGYAIAAVIGDLIWLLA